MKVKRFDNLWTMGLILTSAILVLFYIAKIFFPELIVGVAEIPSIVKFGNYVDSHKWAYFLFDSMVAFIGAYIYCCACIRNTKLSIKGVLLVVFSIVILKLCSMFLPNIYIPVNYCVFAFFPFLICVFDKTITNDKFISCSICFVVDIMAQALSMQIRDIVLMATHLNSATFFILLIDTWIWRVLLYMFFNYKNKIKGE